MNESDVKRFWDNVNKGNDNACWDWGGYLHIAGYGQFKCNRKTLLAHRFVWTIVFGEIPEGLCVCHKCDNKGCVNPNHLFLGTQKDNIQDMISKGRRGKCGTKKGSNVGERHHNAKLTNEQVLEIVRLKGEHTERNLGYMFGVHSSTISMIHTGRNWSSLTGIGRN